tara:strand:+ start:1357 stop:2979 length:1623 start_codon:yes stop_codon:yes gene_type:complete
MDDIVISSLPKGEKKKDDDCCFKSNGKHEEDQYDDLKKWLVSLKLFGLGFRYCCKNDSDFRLTQSRGTLVSYKESLATLSSILENSSGDKDIILDDICSDLKGKLLDCHNYRVSKKRKDECVTSFCNDPFTNKKPDKAVKRDPEALSPFTSSRSIINFLDKIPDDLEEKIETPEEIGDKSVSCWKNIVEVIYTCVISSFLLYIPFWDIVEFYGGRETINVVEFFFDVVPFFQYMCGVLYFRTPHFRHFLFSKVLWSKENYKDYSKWPPNIALVSYISAPISGVVYCILSKRRSIFCMLMSFFYGFYAIPILFNNSLLFFMVLDESRLELEFMRSAVKKGKGALDRRSAAEMEGKELPINISELITNLNGFRYSHEKSVMALNCIFAWCVFLGFSGSAILIIMKVGAARRGEFKGSEDHFHMYVAATIWAILFGSYMAVVSGVSKCKREMVEYLRSPYYTRLYLSRIKLGTNGFTTRNDYRLNMLLHYDTATTVEWSILNTILIEPWKEFNIMGVNVVSKMLPALGGAIVSVLVSVTKIFI